MYITFRLVTVQVHTFELSKGCHSTFLLTTENICILSNNSTSFPVTPQIFSSCNYTHSVLSQGFLWSLWMIILFLEKCLHFIYETLPKCRKQFNSVVYAVIDHYKLLCLYNKCYLLMHIILLTTGFRLFPGFESKIAIVCLLTSCQMNRERIWADWSVKQCRPHVVRESWNGNAILMVSTVILIKHHIPLTPFLQNIGKKIINSSKYFRYVYDYNYINNGIKDTTLTNKQN